jgi:hypothetical protein
LAPELERLGYRLSPKEPDYWYRAADLAALAGDRYRSQRALCNRFEREQSFEVDSYQVRDRQDCRALLKDWSRQKQAEGLESFVVMLLADAAPAHEFIWAQASALQVTGKVVRSHGRLCAYTFGYWLTSATFCVLLEVTDRTLPGLAQYLFDTLIRHTTEDAYHVFKVRLGSALLLLSPTLGDTPQVRGTGLEPVLELAGVSLGRDVVFELDDSVRLPRGSAP